MWATFGKAALEVWAGARSRCHHTFAEETSASRRYAERASPGRRPVYGGRCRVIHIERPVDRHSTTTGKGHPTVQRAVPRNAFQVRRLLQ